MQPVVDYKRYVPHKQGSDSVLFVTWRQNLTIPKATIQKLAKHKSAWGKAHPTDEDQYAYHVERFEIFDAELAKYSHPLYSLTRPDIAQIITNALHFHAGKKYCLHSYTIMSNHVHILFCLLKDQNDDYYRLPDLVRDLKSYTANRINQIVANSGQVWKQGYYDRIIRNDTDYWNVVKYILNNPVKARVVQKWEEYPYSYWNSSLQYFDGVFKTQLELHGTE